MDDGKEGDGGEEKGEIVSEIPKNAVVVGYGAAISVHIDWTGWLVRHTYRHKQQTFLLNSKSSFSLSEPLVLCESEGSEGSEGGSRRVYLDSCCS